MEVKITINRLTILTQTKNKYVDKRAFSDVNDDYSRFDHYYNKESTSRVFVVAADTPYRNNKIVYD